MEPFSLEPSLASHTFHREDGSGHTATIEFCHDKDLL